MSSRQAVPRVRPHDAADAPPEAYLDRTWSTVWTAGLGVVLAGLGVLYVFVLAQGLQAAFDRDGEAAQAIEDQAQTLRASDLWIESTFSLVTLALIPLLWVALTRVRPHPGTWRYLHLQRSDWAMESAKGVGLGLLLWLAVIVLSVLQMAIQGDLKDIFADNGSQDSPLIEAIGRNITWPLALFIAGVAAFAEELFFRGVLQRWIGWWGQAIVFGLVHSSYGTIEQVVFPFALGLVFGLAVHRGHSLYLVMAAHFVFNFVQFVVLLTMA